VQGEAMTIPFVVTVAAATIWLLTTLRAGDEVDSRTVNRILVWLGEAARLTFFAAMLVTLWSVMNKALA
jgi:hypothetical protein